MANNFTEKANFIWTVANLIRNDFKRSEYQDIILPLSEDIQTFFARKVFPPVPDPWIKTNVRDDMDDEVSKVGYEINFNRYFYEHQPLRDLEVTEAEVKKLEKEIMDTLREVAD